MNITAQIKSLMVPPGKQIIQSQPSGGFGTFFSGIKQIPEAAGTIDTPAQNPLSGLIEFLNMTDVSTMENGGTIEHKLLLDGPEFIDHSILGEWVGLPEGKETEDWIASLLDSLEKGDETGALADLTAALELLLSSMNTNKTSAEEIMEQEPLLKMAKLLTILQGSMDLNNNKANRLETLNQLLSKITEKLGLPQAKPQDKAFTYLLTRKNQQAVPFRLHADAQQGKEPLPKTGSLTEGNTVTNNPFLQMSKTEQFVLALSAEKPAVNSEQILKAFEQLMAKAKFSGFNGTQKMLLKLNPEHLGSLRIELIQKEGIMTARIITSTGAAKELLEAQLQGLKQAFAGQNITMEKIEITQTSNSLPQDRHTGSDEGSQQEEEKGWRQTKEEDEQEAGFLQHLEEAKINKEV